MFMFIKHVIITLKVFYEGKLNIHALLITFII